MKSNMQYIFLKTIRKFKYSQDLYFESFEIQKRRNHQKQFCFSQKTSWFH